MATKKKLLQAAAGTAAAGGAGALSVENVFSTYLYEGNGSTQVIENGINLGQSYGSGSVKFDGVDDYMSVPASTDFEFGTGDFTVEAWVNTDYSDYFNIWQNSPVTSTAGSTRYFIGVRTDGSVEFSFHSGGGGFTTSAGAVSQGTWAHVAIVRNSGTTYIYVDGVQQTSSSLLNGYNFNLSSVHTIGYRVTPNYASGYIADLRVVKGTAVYTSSFTAPTSPLTAITNTVLLTCQGDGPFVDNSSSSHTVTVDGAKASTFGPFDAAEAGEGGLVWTKQRSGGEWHTLGDTERGATQYIFTNATNANVARSDGITSFNSDGYSLSNWVAHNESGANYASWTFRKAPKFFDVVTYTGDGVAGRQISHNLGAEVGMMIIKSTSISNSNWVVYHRSNANTEFMYLNGTVAKSSALDWFNSTTPTTTAFTVNNYTKINGSGETFVAYLFAHNDGDGGFGPTGDQDIIKCGTYTGSGSAGNEIDLGFEPQWLLVKSSSSNQNWELVDTMRGFTSGSVDERLRPASTATGESSFNVLEPTSTGFKTGTSVTDEINASGETYIYIAIRRGPMAVPESATDVFDVTLNPTSPNVPSNTLVDSLFFKSTGSAQSWWVADRLRQGAGNLQTDTTAAETSSTYLDFRFDQMTGTRTVANSFGSNYVGYTWKRAPNYFDVVAYTGNGTAGRTVSHNLGVAPEMIWVKQRNTTRNWAVFHSGTGNTKHLELNTTDAAATDTHWNNTTPTSTEFTVGTNTRVNESAGTYIAYLFASLDGVSKVGSYTGTGSDQTIDCGFSSGARFVLVKRTDTSGTAWWVIDTERGLTTGNDPRLALNDSGDESSNFSPIDPASTGFLLKNGYGDFNASGGSYIFYAIA